MSDTPTPDLALLRCLQPAALDRGMDVPDWFALRTHVGVRADNQDRVMLARWSQLGRECWVVAVADGIGSGKVGGEAAALALTTLLSALVSTQEPNADLRLGEATERSNQAVHSRWRGNEGTTLAAVLVDGDRATVVCVGDSRVYGIDDAGACELLSVDDVLPGRPGQLLQFIGMGRDLVPHLSPVLPDYSRVLLTSDGVNQASLLLDQLVSASPSDRQLVERLTWISRWCGGGDNATCALAKLTHRTHRTARTDHMSMLDLWTPDTHHVFPLAMLVSSRQRLPANKKSATRPARKKALTADAEISNAESPRAERTTQPEMTMIFDEHPAAEHTSPEGEP